MDTGRGITPADPRFRAVLDELGVVRPDGPSALPAALAELRRLADVEALVCASPIPSTAGWALDRFHAENLPNPSRFRALLAAYLSRSGDTFGWFNAARPEPDQANVLVDLRDFVPEHELEASRGYTEVLLPLRLQRHHVARALLCESDTLLAWFGVFHPTALEPWQHALLTAALPALRRRLTIEKQLESAPLVSAALAAVLDHIAVPAFVISSSGRIFDVNGAGRAMLETRRAEVSAAILAALAGEESRLPVELTPLEPSGTHDHWLAVVRTRTADSRMNHAVARASARLKLTRRQREVLARVVAGESNSAIATALKVSERAIEQHMTALFDRAAVDSRAALVTFVLLG